MIDNKTLLGKLIQLSKIDVALARIKAERKKLEADVLSLHGAIKKEEQERQGKSKTHDEKKGRYQKEEKRLRDESEKLVARRKALTTLNNYKLQQSAEKEIEHAARQITSQEEALLETLEEVEKLAAEIKSHDDSLKELKSKYDKSLTEAKATLASLEERSAAHNEERQKLVVEIDAKNLTIYERVKERNVMDPLVEVENNLCKGCNMQIGPQVIVLIGKADSLVRCPGCARILYIADGVSQETASAKMQS